MTNKEYADLLLPGVEHTWEEYEAMYPERNLPEGAIVTRYLVQLDFHIWVTYFKILWLEHLLNKLMVYTF